MNPIPWWTYPAIAFLEERLRPSMRVLEFGSGYSTIWLCKRVAKVISVESDVRWAENIRSKLPTNGKIIVAEITGLFSPGFLCTDERFDLIVIDNEGDRMEAARRSQDMLAEEGVILWDNTDGPDWPEIKSMMASFGFREISFQGMIPQEVCLGRTTIFYREGNCLGI